jgi:hypothetical protein
MAVKNINLSFSHFLNYDRLDYKTDPDAPNLVSESLVPKMVAWNLAADAAAAEIAPVGAIIPNLVVAWNLAASSPDASCHVVPHHRVQKRSALHPPIADPFVPCPIGVGCSESMAASSRQQCAPNSNAREWKNIEICVFRNNSRTNADLIQQM